MQLLNSTVGPYRGAMSSRLGVLASCRADAWFLIGAYAREAVALTALVLGAWWWHPSRLDRFEFGARSVVVAGLAIPLGWWVSSVIHNAGHGNFPRWVNRWLGEWAGAWLGYGFTSFILIHSLHHAFADDEHDPVAPRGQTFWSYWLAPLRLPTKRARFYLRACHQGEPGYEFIARGEAVLFHLNLVLRVLLWFVLCGPTLFVSGYVVSIISNVSILAHINFACHRNHDDGSIEVVNLDHTLYYRLANLVTSGGYFHKNHHLYPRLFDPRAAATPAEPLFTHPATLLPPKPRSFRGGSVRRYFDLDGLWGER